jgi:protein-L-isoaspartate(D-aspartate) O-methyltransferase
MLAVDRAHFAPTRPYKDAPQAIGHAATISAPHMHASACTYLLPSLKPGANVLDVGSGSGYLSAVLANLVGSSGKVVGIDHIQELVDLSETNMRKSEEGTRMLDTGHVRFVVGDGRLGYKEAAPYDAIHVGAAADKWHDDLIEQLAIGGRMFIPVGDHAQAIWLVVKGEDGEVTKEKLMAVQYVRLTDHPSKKG